MSASLALGAVLLFDVRVVTAMLLLAELLALVPKGRSQLWKRALGALMSEAVAALACSVVLLVLAVHPSGGLLRHPHGALHPAEYLFIVAAGVFFAGLQFTLLQLDMAVRTGQPIRSSVLGSYSYGGWLVAAQASAGVLAALMYPTMGGWGLGIAVVMILVMRQSFVLLLEIRQGYNATVNVLIKAMEAQSPGREGVAEKNAYLCTTVGREIGMHGRELERLRYAALLLGVGCADENLEQDAIGRAGGRGPSRIVEDVQFLQDVLPILKVCDSPSSAEPATRSDLSCAYLVMSVGASTNTVSREQLARIRSRVSPRVAGDIDQALNEALSRGTIRASASGDP